MSKTKLFFGNRGCALTLADTSAMKHEVASSARNESRDARVASSADEITPLLVGAKVPDAVFKDIDDKDVKLYSLLANKTTVLVYYRGGWCPYCNMEMKALHAVQGEIEASGARLVGMAPEMPDMALSTAKRNAIRIDILSDAGNRVAEELGLVFELPQALRPIYEKFGIDIPKHNGDQSFKLPVPATYIIRQDRVIAYAFVNADYTERLEPAEIVAELKKIQALA